MYTEAHPCVLSNYLFSCTPLKPGKMYTRDGQSRGDFLKVVRPHDEETIGQPVFEPEFTTKFEDVLGTLFDSSWDAVIEQQRARKVEAETEESFADYSDGSSEASVTFTDEDSDGGESLDTRGLHTGTFLIKKNPFFQFVRRIGSQKAAKLRHVRIIWGQDETLRTGERL
jgi:hypothetical protein